MLLSAPGVTLAAILLTAPGVLWAIYCYPSGSYATRVVVGLALGLAFQWQCSAMLAAGPGITRLSVALTTSGGLLLAGVLAWRRRHTFRLRRMSWQPRRAWLLLAILGVSAGISAIPLAAHTIPQGWDPSFHALLASTTVVTGRLPTWAPYEPIPLNYPYGPHVFIAEISLLTGIAPDQVFGVLLNLLTPLATGLALYAFARRAWRDTGAALGAVAAYAFLGNWGSLDYGAWGGLPNALGFVLVLAFLLVFFARGAEWTRVLVGGALLGAISLAHHHVMLTAALLLVGYGLALGLWALAKRGQSGGRLALRQLRRLGLTTLVALVTVSYFAVPYLARARDIGNSDVLRYADHFTGLIFDKNGWLLWVLALIGLGCVVSFAVAHDCVKLPLRLRWTGPLAFTVVASVLLLLAFLFGYYGYRAYSLRIYHHPYTAFTPTRFLTDLTYFLAVFAGPPLAMLWRRADENRWSRMPWTRSVARAAIVLALIFTAGLTILSQFVPDQGHLEPGEAAVFAWIERATPADTVVMNLDPTNRWAPYFTRREATQTPVPTSEFTTGYVAEKRYLAGVLLSLIRGDRLIAFAADGTALPALEARPVALLSDTPLPPAWNGSLRFQNGPERVYLLGNAFGQSLAQTPTARWWSGRQPPPVGWQTSENSAGWAAQPPGLPTTTGEVYLRLTVPGGMASPLRVSCEAPSGGRLFIDGKSVPESCVGSWQTFPELATPGAHKLAFVAFPGRILGPWFDMAVMTGSN
ncbi:MAG TPA: hypothetical protein VJO13_03265 [Ktedonobacterales bacterium]|nr:hypothetical protein [Ktedonobacterales bacterium]